MIRRNYMVTIKQDEQLSKEAVEIQVSKSEILRKAIDFYFTNKRIDFAKK